MSFTAESMDAIAFLRLGGVFTSAMSGNTIIFGLAVRQGHFGAALHCIIAFFGYVTGVALSAVMRADRARVPTLGVEVLFLAAFAALSLFVADPHATPALYGLIGLSTLAMGLQDGVGSGLGVPGFWRSSSQAPTPHL